MKAYKQLDFKNEQRALWSYFTVLSLVSFVILFSPVFAQQEKTIEDKPQVKIDVQKEYDEDGNFIGYDSSWCWHWNGAHFRNINHDSVWSGFQNHYNRIMYDINSREFFDSLMLSFWNDSTGHDMLYRFHWPSWQYMNDSAGIPLHDWGQYFKEDFNINEFIPDKDAIEKFRDQQDAFIEKFREYNKEHKKLLEKYFYDYQNEDFDTDTDTEQRK